MDLAPPWRLVAPAVAVAGAVRCLPSVSPTRWHSGLRCGLRIRGERSRQSQRDAGESAVGTDGGVAPAFERERRRPRNDDEIMSTAAAATPVATMSGSPTIPVPDRVSAPVTATNSWLRGRICLSCFVPFLALGRVDRGRLAQFGRDADVGHFFGNSESSRVPKVRCCGKRFVVAGQEANHCPSSIDTFETLITALEGGENLRGNGLQVGDIALRRSRSPGRRRCKTPRQSPIDEQALAAVNISTIASPAVLTK